MESVICWMLLLALGSQAQQLGAGCGESLHCIRIPEGCDPQQAGSCQVFASVGPNTDGMRVDFTLSAQTTTYIAAGITPTFSMDNTDVYACTENREVIRATNTGYSNQAATLIGVSDVSVNVADGVITCRFSRVLSLTNGDSKFFDLNAMNYYVSLAWGGAVVGSSIRKHVQIGGGGPFNLAEAPSSETQPLGAGCGESLHCLSIPPGCDPQQTGTSDSCQAFASVGPNPDGMRVDFTLSAQTTTYIAAGITPTFSMDNTDVYACTENDEVIRSMNTGYSNQAVTLIGVSDVSVNVADGVITCRFSRVLSLSNGDSKFFDLNAMNYYVSLAWGGAVFGSRIGKHAQIGGGGPFNLAEGPSPSDPPPMETPAGGDGATGCGETVGCFQIPDGCNPGTDCDAFSSWVSNAEKTEVNVVLEAKTDTYIAIGFSRSGGMADSEVYACTSNLDLKRSMNEGYSNKPLELKGVLDGWQVTDNNGMIHCNFTRMVTLVEGNDGSFFNLSSGNEHHILMAWSGALNPDGTISPHMKKEASAAAVDVTAIAAVKSGAPNNSGRILRQLHGVLMVLAWLCFASIGLTTARFFKDLPGKMFGKPKWFFIHQGVMSSAFVCCVIAFILVIVAVRGVYQIGGSHANIVRSIHAIFGFIVTGLCIINVLMALVRPHPGTPKRGVFDWAHWGVGTSAHLLAFVTILAGTANFAGSSQSAVFATLKPYTFWIVVGFVVFHFFLWAIFTGYSIANKHRVDAATNDIPLEAVNGTNKGTIPAPQADAATLPSSMIALCGFYYSVTLAATIAIIIIIFIQ